MAATAPRRRFTAEEYHCMATAGILGEDDRVELIDGEILEMAPIGSPHAGCVISLTVTFSPLSAAGRAFVSVQNPLRLTDDTEPEPDVVLLRPRDDLYRNALPGPEDALLVIEVADSTLAYDRDVKLPRYAAAGIAEAWLVDLTHEQVLVCRVPAATGYQQVTTLTRGDTIAPLAFPDLVLSVNAILG